MATAVPSSPQPPPTPSEPPPQVLAENSSTNRISCAAAASSSASARTACPPSPSQHSCCSDHSSSSSRHHHHHHHHCHHHRQHDCGAHCSGITRLRSRSAAHQSDTMEEKVRLIMRSNATSTEKAAQIHDLFSRQRAAVSSALSSTKRGVFPGQGAKAGCEHYKRKCWIKAPCCDKYYPCRRCHDEAEDHEIDRHAISMIACVQCGDKDQPVARTCRTCGCLFAKYFCAPCRLYNDDDSTGRTAYHCDKCGICRVGLGLGIDNHHCDRCNTCVPIERIHDHPCRERTLDSNCPICNVHLATSTESSYVLPCSHSIHVECLEQYVKAGNYTCPLCSKCLLDKATMKKWYETLDERLKLDQMPPEFENRVSKVLCNDCETKTVAKFHFRFHKCKDCGGYNTKVLEQWDVEPAEPSESSESNGTYEDERGMSARTENEEDGRNDSNAD